MQNCPESFGPYTGYIDSYDTTVQLLRERRCGADVLVNIEYSTIFNRIIEKQKSDQKRDKKRKNTREANINSRRLPYSQ
jgi:hypothetical protein